MEFYKSISKYYDHIFKTSKTQIDFVKSFIPNHCERILDIGCGTGNLLTNLDVKCEKFGIDLDEKMLDIAKEKDPSIRFQKMNMLDIEKEFFDKKFDLITCFGNTLVHLEDDFEISRFILSVKQLLKENGVLLIQIINYDRVLHNNIYSLATIENDHIKFVRKYKYFEDINKIGFNTNLLVKYENIEINNNVHLHPILKNDLHLILEKADLKDINYYGNFKKEPLNDESVPLIISCKNN